MTPPADAVNRDLLDQTARLRWRIEQLEAELVQHLAEVDKRRAFADDGAVSTVGWLKNRCRMDTSRAGQLVKLARAADDFPELRRAHSEARISGCEARRILHGGDTYRRDLQRQGMPSETVDNAVGELRNNLLEAAANGEGTDRLRREIDSHRHKLAAESVVFDENIAHEQRELHFYTSFDGMVDVRGTLDPISAATVRSAIDALCKPTSTSDETSAGQRRADALIQLANGALTSGKLPETGGRRPQINVTVSDRTLTAEPGEPGTLPAELDQHGPVSGETARMLSCDGEITRILHTPESGLLDVGRSTRTVPTALRKALALRDGGCTHPRCDRPVEWCDVHHVQHWAHGGPTNLDNCVLLCRRHHTEEHLGDRAEGVGDSELVGSADTSVATSDEST